MSITLADIPHWRALLDPTGVPAGYVLTADGADSMSFQPSSGGGASVTASWRFSTSLVAADPGNGRFRLNNADASLATQIYIDDLTDGNVDFSTIFNLLSAGDKIYIQNEGDANEAILVSVVTVTDNTGWFTIDITFQSVIWKC